MRVVFKKICTVRTVCNHTRKQNPYPLRDNEFGVAYAASGPAQSINHTQLSCPLPGQGELMSVVNGTLPDTIEQSNHMRPFRTTLQKFSL